MIRRLLLPTLLLLPACAPAEPVDESPAEALSEIMAEGNAILARTRTLSAQIEQAWGLPDGGTTLANLAADPELFHGTITAYLGEAGLEQLPEITKVTGLPHAEDEAAAVLLTVAKARIRLGFDPLQDPAVLTTFDVLPPHELQAAIENGPPAPPATAP